MQRHANQKMNQMKTQRQLREPHGSVFGATSLYLSKTARQKYCRQRSNGLEWFSHEISKSNYD